MVQGGRQDRRYVTSARSNEANPDRQPALTAGVDKISEVLARDHQAADGLRRLILIGAGRPEAGRA